MNKRSVSIFTVMLMLLAGVNIVFLAFAMQANQNAARAYGERHAIISSIYEASIAGGTFTRLARYYAIVGDESTYKQFRAEETLNRYSRTQEIFVAYNATAEEIERMEQVKAQRLLMLDYFQEVLRLRREGYTSEAIVLAHGPAIARIGQPAGPMSDNVRDMVIERTTMKAAGYRSIAGIFGELAAITSVLLVLGSVICLIVSGVTKMPRRVEIFGAAFLVFALISLFLSVSARLAVMEKLDIYGQQYALINASYNAERGTEILTRLSRMYVVTGEQTQFSQYFAELERDRFGSALDDFVMLSAESYEINILVDILGRLTMLRQIEAEVMLLRAEGYFEEALEKAFGPEVAALDRPLGILGEELREAVNSRTNKAIDTLTHRGNMAAFAAFFIALALVIIGFAKLLVINQTPDGTPPGIVASTIKKIKNATIKTKLFASFIIVIIFFTAQVGIDAYFDVQIYRLSRHNKEFLARRSETLWAFHQEFTEMRRILLQISSNSECPNDTNTVELHLLENRLFYSHARLVSLKETYEDLVRRDPVFPKTDEDSRIVILEGIMSYVDMTYEFYMANFFAPAGTNVLTEGTIDYTSAAKTMIGLLRQFVNVNQTVAEKQIEYYRYVSGIATIFALAAAIVLAILMAYSMLRSFSGRINTIEAAADKVAQGHLDTGLQSGTDEISAVFAKMVGAFAKLISEIKYVMEEGEKGNTYARINTGRFKGGYKETAIAINMLLDTAEELIKQKEFSLVAQRANEEKSKFLARMSHEIRTPISAVLGISEIELQNPGLPAQLEESFVKIHNSAGLLLNIVNDILDLSKIEAGKMELSQEEYDVANMILDIAQMHFVHLRGKDIKFRLCVDENLPAFLFGDHIRVMQIVNNLLSNAFKYTEAGSVELSWHCHKHEAKEDYVNLVISISDTGLGMTKEQLATLRNSEYTRFHEKENRYISGTGLGVPIVINLLRMMNADINMESEVGKGTKIKIYLPQKIPHGKENKIIDKETAERLHKFDKDTRVAEKKFTFVPDPMPYGSVLVVDDVKTNLYVAKGLLAFYDLKVETCRSGNDAIEKIKLGETYDIVFMDIMMPDLNGDEAMCRMRELGYTRPIVALTANAMIGQEKEFLKRGFDDFITKPIQTKFLNSILNKYIRDKQPPEIIEAARLARKNKPVARTTNFNNDQIDAGLQKIYRQDFARNHKNTYSDLLHAVNSGDVKTARLLAHNLKGIAGLIQEKQLAQAAEHAESLLNNNEILTGEDLSALENAFNRTLKDIGNPETMLVHSRNFDKDKVMTLFKKLKELLESRNVDSASYLDELAAIPETIVLRRQIEDMDFREALTTLSTLMSIFQDLE